MSKGKGQKVSRRDLAAVFGVSLPTVDAWVRQGCPFDQRGGRGKEWTFDTADVARWREERAAQDAGGEETQDIDKLKLRKLRAETQAAELQLMKDKGLVAPLDQVERTLSRALAEVQSNLRGRMITRLVTQLIGETDERRFKRIALAEVDEVLESLAALDISADEADTPDEDEEPADENV